jgi:di/tricarboxylate transporter
VALVILAVMVLLTVFDVVPIVAAVMMAAMAVLIAASGAFMTPVSTPVVTLVVEPGRYGFMDFVKVGVPLTLLTWVVTLLLAPLLFPFEALA